MYKITCVSLVAHTHARTHACTDTTKIKFTQESSKMKMSIGHHLLLLPKV